MLPEQPASGGWKFHVPTPFYFTLVREVQHLGCVMKAMNTQGPRIEKDKEKEEASQDAMWALEGSSAWRDRVACGQGASLHGFPDTAAATGPLSTFTTDARPTPKCKGG